MPVLRTSSLGCFVVCLPYTWGIECCCICHLTKQHLCSFLKGTRGGPQTDVDAGRTGSTPAGGPARLDAAKLEATVQELFDAGLAASTQDVPIRGALLPTLLLGARQIPIPSNRATPGNVHCPPVQARAAFWNNEGLLGSGMSRTDCPRPRRPSNGSAAVCPERGTSHLGWQGRRNSPTHHTRSPGTAPNGMRATPIQTGCNNAMGGIHPLFLWVLENGRGSSTIGCGL